MAEFRLHDTNTGRQLVQVQFDDGNGQKYTYMWLGPDRLVVGDEVSVNPPMWSSPSDFNPRKAKVVELGSDYEGSIVCLTRRWGG